MKYLLDETRKELDSVNRKFEEIAHGNLAYHFCELFARENNLGAILKNHQEERCALESRARMMDGFECGYDKARESHKDRQDTVEFWQAVIKEAQIVINLEESCQKTVNRWNESQHSYSEI